MTVDEKTYLEATLRRAAKLRPSRGSPLPSGCWWSASGWPRNLPKFQSGLPPYDWDPAFEHGLKRIRPGMTEAQLAAEIEYFAWRNGAEGMSFDTLIAGGRRSALPHGVASANRLPRKGPVDHGPGCYTRRLLLRYDLHNSYEPGGSKARRIYFRRCSKPVLPPSPR